MQTSFTAQQLTDPSMASSEQVIRKCVHCGFCTATCPTYVLLGNELDSPRGRIYLIKDMLENERVPTREVVQHLDRCLSCLSCLTTCPSGVNYMHLIDNARAYIEQRYTRSLSDRFYRRLLAWVLPSQHLFRAALALAKLARPFRALIPHAPCFGPLRAMLALAPDGMPRFQPDGRLGSVAGRKGVILLKGCAEPVLRPEYRAAALRVLDRLGFNVIATTDEGCCGALVHHLGREDDSLDAARRNVDSWMHILATEQPAAILTTASGCGTTLKNYGFLLRDDPDYAVKAQAVSDLVMDISEFLAQQNLPLLEPNHIDVAYHAACSLQHGQKIIDAPRHLLERLGYRVRTPREAHLCCGSAGTYNILQPAISEQLGMRKSANLKALEAELIVTCNIGCAVQIGRYSGSRVVHLVELIDQALAAANFESSLK